MLFGESLYGGHYNYIYIRNSEDYTESTLYFLGEHDDGSEHDVNVHANNFVEYDLSSARENSRTISYGLNTVMNLSPKEYNNVNFPTRNRVGFIPQEVEEFIPEVIFQPEQEGGRYSINYSKFTPVLTKAIQELKNEKDAEIDELELQNYELQRILSKLEMRIRELEKK